MPGEDRERDRDYHRDPSNGRRDDDDRDSRDRDRGRRRDYDDDDDDDDRRRRRRRGNQWDKDASGNAVAPPPAVVAAAGAVPVATLAALAGPATVQQQAALTRKARRLHIGSLPPGCTGAILKELFDDALHKTGMTLNGAREVVNDVQVEPGGKFAFMEFRTVHEATMALALDSLIVLGKAIRVQRPNDYTPAPPELNEMVIPPGTVPAGAVHGAASHSMVPTLAGLAPVPPANVASALNAQLLLAGTGNAQQTAQQISRKARRLHIGNLPQNAGLTPTTMMQFFNATLKTTGLVDASKPGDPVVDCSINPNGKFAFVEFRTIAETTSALTLNNVELVGRQLRVERPRDYAPVPLTSLDELVRAGVVGETPICNLDHIRAECASGARACAVVRPPLSPSPSPPPAARPSHPPTHHGPRLQAASATAREWGPCSPPRRSPQHQAPSPPPLAWPRPLCSRASPSVAGACNSPCHRPPLRPLRKWPQCRLTHPPHSWRSPP